MRYFKLEDKNLFFKEPKEFNKWTNKEILKYSLGANIYMNGGKDFFEKIISGYFSSTGAISICFEDAVKENEVKSFEKNVISNLDKLHKYVCNNEEIKNNRSKKKMEYDTWDLRYHNDDHSIISCIINAI